MHVHAHSPDKTQRESDFRWVLFFRSMSFTRCDADPPGVMTVTPLSVSLGIVFGSLHTRLI